MRFNCSAKLRHKSIATLRLSQANLKVLNLVSVDLCPQSFTKELGHDIKPL